jgi:long-chain acyl-CoA synthetase
MLTHYNFVSNVIYSAERVPATQGKDKALSFLPINHVYERMLTYLYQYLGLQIWYAESLETIGDNLKEVKPEVFSTVPRLLEKVYDKIIGKGKELTGVKRALFFWAVDLGLKYELWGKNGWWYETQLKLANKLIFSKWREALGGNVKAIVSGGAALQPRLARIFWAAQIPVLEGYGLTETSPVIAVNYLATQDVAFGTVGPVLRDHEIKIAEDGEILAKGPNIMIGYYNRPDATAEVIDKDGYFHTGDIGELVDGKYLKITDRKKEIFKTSGGKYIAPQVIENKLKESNFIEQAMVIGENQKFAAALIVASFEFLQKWCEHKEIPFTNPAEMIKNKIIKDRIMEEVEHVNKGLGKFETIKQIILLPELFSIEKGELTPKLSLRRKIIMQNNKQAIEELYAQA